MHHDILVIRISIVGVNRAQVSQTRIVNEVRYGSGSVLRDVDRAEIIEKSI